MNRNTEAPASTPSSGPDCSAVREAGISGKTLDMVARLVLWRRKVFKSLRRGGLALCVCGFLAVVFSIIAYRLDPQLISISSVDIPNLVLESFDANNGRGVWFEDMYSFLEDIMPFLIGFVLISGFILSIATQSTYEIFLAVAGSLALQIPLAVGLSGGSEPASPSSRDAFVAMVESNDYLAVKDALAARSLEDKPAGAYVLAQIGVAAGLEKDADTIAALRTSARLASNNEGGFGPSAKVLYAVDLALFGQPQSEAAEQYLKARSQLQDGWGLVARMGTSGAVIGSLLVLLAALLLNRVSSRLKRLHRMLAPYTVTA